MPESSIETYRTLEYGNLIYSLSQQTKSKFSRRCRREMIVGAKAKSFNRLGEADGQEVATRHGDTPLNELPHSRRWVSKQTIDTGTLLDEEDTWDILSDPTNKYAQHQGAYLARKTDDIFITAALGSATAGESMGTTVDFKDDSISINGDGTATSLGTLATAAGSGSVADISLAKMLLMAQIFDDGEVDEDIPRYWAVRPKSIYDMLDLTEVGSADYNIVKALVEGKIEKFMGFEWVKSTRITKDAASETAYRSIAWAEDGMIIGSAKDVFVRMSERDDKRYSKQVYSKMSLGAVRMEGAKVHECLNKVA